MNGDKMPELIVDAEDMSLKEKERLTSVAKSMTESLLEATDLLGGTPWRLVHEKHGISLFRADVANDVPCNVHAVCKFGAEIEDVAESMISNTTEGYLKMMRMLSSDFIDGAVVQNIVEPTALNPHRYVALKWAAFKSSNRFGKDRDFIILEYVDMIEDDQGQKIAFRVMESVDVPNNSLYAESAKYTRDIVPLMGFMYHTTKKPGELRLTYTCNFDKNGDLPAWAANSAIQSHVEKCVNGILKYIEIFRLNQEEIVLPQKVLAMNEQDFCRICEKNFCVLRRKYNCLKCGEVICSNCSSLRTTKVPDVGERQLRVCTACVLAARRTSRNNSNNNNNSHGESVSSTPYSTTSVSSSSYAFSSICGSSSPSMASMQTTASDLHSGSGSASTTTSAGMARTQSFSHRKRRSFDDLLDPVRSRLIEYKTFSDTADAGNLPRANFPTRSFSDGLIMHKVSMLSAKRRGSPADLAISIEAFRQHQLRMGNGDPQAEGDEERENSDDEDTMSQLQVISPTSSSGDATTATVNATRVAPEQSLASLHATQPLIENSSRRAQRKYREADTQCVTPSVANGNARERLDEAMEKAQGIIDAAAYANNLAQHARKLSHHRISALQREHLALTGIRSSPSKAIDRYDEVHSPMAQPCSSSSGRHAVLQTKDGATAYSDDPTVVEDHEVKVVAKSMATLASTQYVDASYYCQTPEVQPVYTSERSRRGGDRGRKR